MATNDNLKEQRDAKCVYSVDMVTFYLPLKLLNAF